MHTSHIMQINQINHETQFLTKSSYFHTFFSYYCNEISMHYHVRAKFFEMFEEYCYIQISRQSHMQSFCFIYQNLGF